MAKYDLSYLDDTPIFKAIAKNGEGYVTQIGAVKAWGATEAAKKILSNSGSLGKVALLEWIEKTKKNNPKYFTKNGKLRQKKLMDKLEKDPEFYKWFCENQSRHQREWIKNNPELAKERVAKGVEGLKKWRIENPELAQEYIQNALGLAQKAAWEKECWRVGMGVIRGMWNDWIQSEEGLAWRKRHSVRMTGIMNDKNSDHYKNNRKALLESEARHAASLINIKEATKASYKNVVCPTCKKEGAYRVMVRHHFDNCTFNESLEDKAIEKIKTDIITYQEVCNVLESVGLAKNYISKYDVMTRKFKKLHPNKQTSGKYVKINFDIDSYIDNKNKEELAQKAAIKEKERIRKSKKRGSKMKPYKKKDANWASKNVTCPHCNKTAKHSQLARWHFDNCKELSKKTP